MLSVYKKCSGINKRLVADPNCVCRRCNGEALSIRWQNCHWSGCRRHNVRCGGYLLPNRCYAVLRWWLWQCLCCRMLCGLGRVQKNLACPTHQTPLTYDTWQGVQRLCFAVAKYVDQITVSYSSSAAMPVYWSGGSVSQKTETKHPQLHYYKGLGRHGLNVWRLMAIIVDWLVLTEIQGEPMFDAAWCCQSIRIEHRPHLNLNMDKDR